MDETQQVIEAVLPPDREIGKTPVKRTGVAHIDLETPKSGRAYCPTHELKVRPRLEIIQA